MYGYIYLIVNNINGKTYVGKRKLYNKKWNEDGYIGSGKHLKSAQKKYGIENFEKFLITWTYSEEDACEKEKFWISEYRRRGKAEYNIANGGNGGDIRKCYKCSLETRKKISKAKKGKNIAPCSEEHRRKISESNKGKKRSEESRKKMSDAKKGKPSTRKGKSLSDETKKRISEARKGIQFSNETRKKLSEAKKGKHWKIVDGKRVLY